MPQFHAQVPTPRAARNMTRLHKHFAHKAEVWADETAAKVAFAFGECRMHAEAERLLIDCQAEAGEAERRLRFVIADHLKRFSGDEALEVQWRDGPLPARTEAHP
ncbi:DUF2218 domain-containing protein [Stutzerimonas balearica]|jgi:hypothetical protein|uniref:DUF2218 domain-containing protein n=1 Tax=Stutzerimonas balearica DSM 6083 TaxID=1123016 RepID=A0A8D3Y494_9GAMM|nr:DUF2218 domain-containing protein [Stutzerimonas balearica]MBB60220.1 DUF2218 domain-containing protein [Pseudomonas sp.]AJE16662.1 hypothetical protein CL52_17055 [Stutzerimonas balearica DSM 6083]MBC7200661.1 DUF2218 domain-containing protein [Stutzerimonas balearica]MBK3749645.1 DUF2218 domain-containing protein [Stutzerimonas balearica]MBK3827840.1 DUF2218 domain-containing protein [Stutzerimonas balearica]